MKNTIALVLLGIAVTGIVFAKTEADQVKTTMTVNRCQAFLKDGTQCPRQASEGKKFCWQHGASQAVKDVTTGVSESSQKAWGSTKNWSTNAWQSTKSGWNKAVDATKESLDDARVGVVELLGGKDAKK